MSFCRFCGGKTPNDSFFCAHCGHPMQPSLEQEVKVNEPNTPLTTQTLPPEAQTFLSQPLQTIPSHNSIEEEDEEQRIMPPAVPPEAPTTGNVPSVQGAPQVGTVPSIPGGGGAGTVATTLTAGTLAKVVVILATCAAVIFAGIKVIPPILHHPTTTPTTSITPVTKTLPMPPTQTSCPAPGTARAEVTAPLALGAQQNLVYTTSQNQVIFNPTLPSSVTLKRYDMTTGQTTNIVKFDTYVNDVHISTDGQWVLFSSQVNGQAAMQMVRMDGQGLQTLYCNPVKPDPTSYAVGSAFIQFIVWSTDQKLVMFSEGDNSNNPPSLYLLNLVHGTVQKELLPNPGSSTPYYAHLWIDNTHVALLAVNAVNGSADDSILILDTNQGQNQQNNNLKQIATYSTLFTFSLGITPDHPEFILGRSSNLSPYISSISELPVIGGSEHTIFTSQTFQVMDIRVISNTTLLFYLMDPSGTNATDQSGLYKMHLDGTGFTKLFGNNIRDGGVQENAIDVSRDKSMYALGLSVSCGQHCHYTLIQIGFLNGGKSITLPDNNHNDSLVGWTTM